MISLVICVVVVIIILLKIFVPTCGVDEVPPARTLHSRWVVGSAAKGERERVVVVAVWVLAAIVGLINVGGVCHAGRVRAMTLRSMGLAIGGKRFLDVVKPSNYNGSALLGVVKLLSAPANKDVRMTKAEVRDVGSGRLTTFHGGGLKFIFRSFRLVGSLGILSGIRLPLLCHHVDDDRHGQLTRSILTGIKLDRQVHRFPSRLSNNRYRHITITHTVVNGPRVVLTSRPANGLSSEVKTRIVRLLRQLGGRSKQAVIVIARGRRRTGRASQAIHFFSKRRIRWGIGTVYVIFGVVACLYTGGVRENTSLLLVGRQCFYIFMILFVTILYRTTTSRHACGILFVRSCASRAP